MRGHVDLRTSQEISGWAIDMSAPERQVFVEIAVNGRTVGRVCGSVFRADLAAAGYGDGRCGFHFWPGRYLDRPENDVRVTFADTGELVGNGRFWITTPGAVPADGGGQDEAVLADRSKERWRDVEAPADLTWGRMMTGDSFVDAWLQHDLPPEPRLCELGPGYGRVLRTVLERRLPFASFQGIDLSAGRVAQLRKDFADDQRILFTTGDIDDFRLTERADVILCAGTFEHLFPDCQRGLRCMASNTRPGGLVCVDFVSIDGKTDVSRQWFAEGNTYIRVYSARELEHLFATAGFASLQLRVITAGEGSQGPVRRIFASARVPAPRL